MDLTAFLFFLFGLQVVCLVIGRRSSKELNNQDDYFLAGKGVRFFPLMMTFLATQVGGGLILGSAEEAYKFGWSVLFYPLGAIFGLILLGLGMGRRLAQMQVSTIAQIFESVYGSPRLRKLASVFSILSLFMIFVAQIMASHKFIVSLGIENSIWFFGFWGIVIFYTAAGGLKAVVATDVVQATFFGAAFLFCFGYAFFFMGPSFAFDQVWKANDFVFEPSKLYGWLFMPFLFMMIEQDMGQRCFAAASPRIITKATLWAGFCTLFISLIPVFFGVLAKSLNLNIPPDASVLMIAIQHTTTPMITALVGCAILAAIISTADSLLNAISSNLSQDFKWSLHIRASQIMTSVIALVGIFFSFYFTSVVDLLVQSYELSVSCLFIPIVFALFNKQGHALSASLAIGCGLFGFLLFRAVSIPVPREMAALFFSLIGFCSGQVLVWSRSSMGLEKAVE